MKLFRISGRPIQFGNLSFVWLSPNDDQGPVKFVASVVYDDQYTTIDAKINGSRIKNGGFLEYTAFPVGLILSLYL